jgi:acyl carrier protein
MAIKESTESTHKVLQTVADLIREVIGDDLEFNGPITMETSFNRDLELESIEFVVLSEKIQQCYGARVDFVNWLSTKELDDLIEMTVGDLVQFISESLSNADN